jgi:periplasmic protein TonB
LGQLPQQQRSTFVLSKMKARLATMGGGLSRRVWGVRGLNRSLTCVALRRTRDNPIVASAVEHVPTTVSTPASALKPAGESTPAKPRMNAVACEVQVIATGARPAEVDGKRELFTEETTTALVFENGGVLRLAAAVAPGQLLFLTHKESKREVVAQVTRKRDFRPTICYVEVEFSESSPDFWGIQFPETSAAMPAPVAKAPLAQESSQQPEAVEPEPAEPMEEDFIGDEPVTTAAAPTAQEVASLKTEVEALREQLKLLQTQTVAKAMAPEPSQVPVDGPVPANVPAPPLPKLRLSFGQAPEVPATVASSEAGEAAFSEEDLLPKPALNFESAKTARAATGSPEKSGARGQHSAMRKDLLFAAFVVVTAGALWYENLLPGLPRPKFFGPSAAPLAAAQPTPQTPRKATNGQADTSKGPQASVAATVAPSVAPSAAPRDAATHNAPAAVAAPATTKPANVAATEPSTESKTLADAAESAEAAEKPEAVASAGKRSPPPASKAAMVSVVPAAAPGSEEGTIVPPKLIKAVRAVASPAALQEFSSGGAENVTFDAMVDASGHVKPVKVLSGATALRNAATEALKKYEYEPATRRGKPVPAHVTVTVKFLFEP